MQNLVFTEAENKVLTEVFAKIDEFVDVHNKQDNEKSKADFVARMLGEVTIEEEVHTLLLMNSFKDFIREAQCFKNLMETTPEELAKTIREDGHSLHEMRAKIMLGMTMQMFNDPNFNPEED